MRPWAQTWTDRRYRAGVRRGCGGVEGCHLDKPAQPSVWPVGLLGALPLRRPHHCRGTGAPLLAGWAVLGWQVHSVSMGLILRRCGRPGGSPAAAAPVPSLPTISQVVDYLGEALLFFDLLVDEPLQEDVGRVVAFLHGVAAGWPGARPGPLCRL